MSPQRQDPKYAVRSWTDLATKFREMAAASDRVADKALASATRREAKAEARIWRAAADIVDQTTILPREDAR